GYRRFAIFNVAGGVAWVAIFSLGGYWFGNLETVKTNFHYVILAIIVLSVLPPIYEIWRERRVSRAAAAAATASAASATAASSAAAAVPKVEPTPGSAE